MAPARIPTLVAWSALCGICGGVGETPALRNLVYTRNARSENSRRNSVLWGLGPSRPKLVPNLWLWEARAQTMRRPLCLHHLPRTRLCVNACISPHTAPEHTGVRRPEMKR